MKRHPGLQPLSRHHHFALIHALELRRAAKAPLSERAEKLRSAAETFLRFWKEEGRTHFREEEEVLLPAYARKVSLQEDRDVLRMLAQHAEIRTLAADLEAGFVAGADLCPLSARLGQLLHEHVRLEEDVIFPRMEGILGEEALRHTGAHLTELHPPRSCSVKLKR